jgi:hypothetical protein
MNVFSVEKNDAFSAGVIFFVFVEQSNIPICFSLIEKDEVAMIVSVTDGVGEHEIDVDKSTATCCADTALSCDFQAKVRPKFRHFFELFVIFEILESLRIATMPCRISTTQRYRLTTQPLKGALACMWGGVEVFER